jgi:hypothetical protein
MNITYNSIKTNALESFPPLEMGFQLSEYVHKKHTQYIEDGTYFQIKLTIIFTLSYVWSVVKPITIQTIRAIIEGVDNYVQSSLSKEIEATHPEIIEATEPSETLGQTLTEEDFTRRQLLMLAKTFNIKNYSRKSKSEIFLALKIQGNIPEKI